MPTSFTKHAYLFGAMLWIQPDAADEQISADMRSMLDTGLSLARVFITGDSIEQSRTNLIRCGIEFSSGGNTVCSLLQHSALGCPSG